MAPFWMYPVAPGVELSPGPATKTKLFNPYHDSLERLFLQALQAGLSNEKDEIDLEGF